MGSIFHYTDTTGLLGILTSETLFATHYRYLNDVAEAGVIRDLIMPILEAEIAEITPKLIEKGWLDQRFYTEMGTAGHRMQAEAMYRSIVRATNNISPIFVVSFCRHDDGSPEFEHGLLSQWRAYAASGGFAIEFDEDKLDSMLKHEAGQYAYATMKSGDVQYADYNKLFDSTIYKGIAGEMIRDLFSDRHIDTTKITGKKSIDEAIQEYINTAPYMKHWGFHEEREYRVTASCLRPAKAPENETRPEKEIKLRERSDLIVPYVELLDNPNQSFPIKSIIIGPHPQQEKQAEAVKMKLESELINATVRLSAIPYRK